MRKLIFTISLILSCISLVSCSNSPTNTTTEKSTNTTAQSQLKTDTQAETKSTTQSVSNSTNKTQQPQIATVKELVNGDLLCYATLVDEKGIEHQVGASFEICAEEAKFLNKKVRATYTIESVSDCESAEPCGKTRKESIITKMEVLGDQRSSNSENISGSIITGNQVISGEISKEKYPLVNTKIQTISNGEWTISTSNHDSWTGINNTGNISYKGCDTKGKCIELTGGKISCRDGKCVTGWKNGDYIYILEQPITEDGNAASTLIVKKGNSEILKATKLK
ncbi:hypothetical protein H6G54_21760 [Anabaena cylindrica FACHB-243]|uniref:Lipoprotein n=1 Tax=Anabaena cylindrica (strain ATCC 27899 / PCC 7122) TaxID=272123 RepID=K9Z958_ANACC|nr:MULTISPECIES: hypothetical protein [Anabaena]AFZ55713.1 hypothetical protein Anacy_0103 [Anabaena cylindrica PCC 7122]MBD2420283.1 hypothetical protein [Anabaena cylindrica FACHB-243]MBY5282103.1 hypothetical protein [Anabaena sp. CCAP 1446/1C]MBY5309600.1 hypothetical protein [Anabaena sp. CCAP 1446/1C]MCM2406062.1 hypothetical protein [Anabaena sp. CCAP 1446/1C]